MSPKVSVIIPTIKGREKLLKNAVESVLRQTYADFEIIVVSDSNLNVKFNDNRIHIHELPGSNVSQARNFGIKMSRGKLVAFLDDDDEWLPEKLEKQVKLLENGYDLVYSDYLEKYPDGKIVRKGTKILCGEAYDELKRWNFIPTSSVVVRKEVIGEVGGFDKSLMIGEDYDMWLRISKRYKICGVEEPLFIYRKPDKVRYLRYACDFIKFLDKWWNEIDTKRYSNIELWYFKASSKLHFLKYWYYKARFILFGENINILKELVKKYCSSTTD